MLKSPSLEMPVINKPRFLVRVVLKKAMPSAPMVQVVFF
jgi:hypothetical protein